MKNHRKHSREAAVRRTVLSNGLTVLTERIPHVRSVALGVWLRSGSRQESPEQNGISHFIEHMLFKGTTRRSAEAIAKAVDSVGGNLDAFTAKECTNFSIKVLDEHLDFALDLVCDLVLHPRLDPADIHKERSVILEEIKMVEDTPDDLVHEIFTEEYWKDHPLGRPILGTEAIVRSMERASLLKHFRACYTSKNMVVTAAGRLDHDRLVEKIDRQFRRLRGELNGATEMPPKVFPHLTLRPKKSLEQIHLCLGVPSYPIAHKQRYACYVLNTVLGGGMSSRLFQKIREKQGLAYAIFSHLTPYTDTGCLTIYAGTARKTAARVLQMILKELRTLKKTALSREELRRAKEHLKGSLMLGLESTTSRMANLAQQELSFDRQYSLDEVLEHIDQVTSEEVQAIAREFFQPEWMGLTVLGPLNGLRFRRDDLEC